MNSIHNELAKQGYVVLKATELENFVARADEITVPVWPEFMLHDVYANRYWAAMCELAAAYQFVLADKQSGEWLAVGNSVPVQWDLPLNELPDKGWDWAIENGVEGARNDFTPNYLSAIAIQIRQDLQGRGLSKLMVMIMKDLAETAGLQALIAPIRPTRKSYYPLIPMEEYVGWKKDDLPFDPWMRVHKRLGAQIIKVCHQAMHIRGSVGEWTEWTGLSFQSSGNYIIPGALTPVAIDLIADLGTYIEPNLWLVHRFE